MWRVSKVSPMVSSCIVDFDFLTCCSYLKCSYENMTQIMSQLLSDQVAVQNFLEELDANIPRNSESVDDQSDAAARVKNIFLLHHDFADKPFHPFIRC
jgi:hypothetical protein